MGQSCGVERAGGAQPGDAGGAPPTATSRLAAPLEPGSSPALPALGRRTADAGCLQVEEGFDAQVPPQQEQLPRFRLDRFAVERWELGECLVPGRFGSGWRRWYTQGPEIGRGVSAQVYEARASGGDPLGCDALGLAAGAVCDEGHVQCARTACSITGAAEAPWPEPRPRGRRVAVKQFKMYGKDSYSLELVALASVGVHPNVVRLLENYRDPRCGGEDVLVYEFCDGPSLWGLHRDFKRKRKPVPALLAARLVRQMFKALEHLERCGVEHQDVKPDNMLLFDLCLESETAHLKLGDFGWSTVGPWRASRALPQGGIGTLWYAAPELNPPLAPQAPAAEALVGAAKPAPPDNTRSTTVGDSLPEDAELSCTEESPLPRRRPPPRAATSAPTFAAAACGLQRAGCDWFGPGPRQPPGGEARSILGRSDVWSAGVVTYTLLVGSWPFQAALREGQSNLAREHAVMSLVAQGGYCTESPCWRGLPADVRALVTSCLQVNPARRPSAASALRCGWLAQALADEAGGAGRPPAEALRASEAWLALDGLQQLAWAAVARAAGEPELRPEVVAAATAGAAPGDAGTGYLLQLAQQVAAVPVERWLRDMGTWPEILRLAFRYLDVDGDGFLSAQDLAEHVDGPGGVQAARRWISRWACRAPRARRGSVEETAHRLELGDFRAALQSGEPPTAYATA